MSNSQLLKYLERPMEFKSLVSRPVLISDSKGVYLKRHLDLLKKSRIFVQFECRPGARFANFITWLKKNLSNLVQQHGWITLYIWLGTCDTTQKSGIYIDLRYVDSTLCVKNIVQHIDLFVSFIGQFKEGVPIFLEIPPYSVVEWNRAKGHSNPQIFKEKDKTLNETIGILKDYIKNVNSVCLVTGPRFKLDLLKYRKEKGKCQRVSYNFQLYVDDIHPCSMLARVWLKRLIECICIHSS